MASFSYKVVMRIIKILKYIELLVLKLFPFPIERIISESFAKAGITINGTNPWDIKIKEENKKVLFYRMANQGSLGLGEAYVEGLWDSDDVTELWSRMIMANTHRDYFNPYNRFLNYLECKYFNLQSKDEAWEVGKKHYDKGNDLFESFLDPSMNYSCGYWRTATDLNQAQIDKMNLIANKLSLKPGMRVLDIGCGWGGLAKHLAENYGVEVVGITISKEGARYGQEVCSGLPVDIRLMDYRNLGDLNEKFDRIASVGSMEHFGHNNYKEFFQIVNSCLKDDGVFIVHTIGINHMDIPCSEQFFQRYIFPNCILPYYKHITDCTEGLFIIEDWQNMGNNYYKTCQAWLEKFKKNWPTIEIRYDEKFYRLWTYYLQAATSGFKARRFQLWQVVFSKNGI